MFTIKSVRATIHDTGFGGYPYKVVVTVAVDAKAYSKLPVLRKAKNTICGHTPAARDLGSLVVAVNNAVYAFNPDIPAHNPSIDSKGGSRAKNGVKSMEFVYFFKDHETAKNLGFEFFSERIKNHDGEPVPKYDQNFELKSIAEFKANLDGLTFEDILEFRAQKAGGSRE